MKLGKLAILTLSLAAAGVTTASAAPVSGPTALALEPTDALSRERLAQLIEDLEFELLTHRLAA